MSEDKCLYCGTPVERKHKGWSRLYCGSVRYDSDGTFKTFYNRDAQCYETQLTALKSLLRKGAQLLQQGALPNSFAVQGYLKMVRAIVEGENADL